MNTYVERVVLPVGYEMQIGDPNSGEEVTIRVTKSGWTEKGGQCSCHPQWYEMFQGEVIEGFEPGRIVRGYTDTFDQYDQEADEEYEDICAFILADQNLDEIARDLRLAREGKLATETSVNQHLLATLEHVMILRDQLQGRGWDADYLRNQLRPEDGSLDLRFFESCGSEHHRGTGWLNGHSEVVHDGHLVKTPGSTTWDSAGLGEGPKQCGCVSSRVQGHSVVRHRGYPQVYMTAEASVECAEEFLRDALADSHPEFRENVRDAIPAIA